MDQKQSNKLQKFIIGGIENFLFITFTLMVLLVFINVMGRYFFHSGITESEELSKILFVWISFIGAILCFHEDSHITVDIVVTFLPPMPKRIVNIIANILASFILAVTFYYSINFILVNRGMQFPLTKISVVLVQSIIPVSMAIMFIMNIGKLFKLIIRR